MPVPAFTVTPDQPLTTERLILRPYRPDDVPSLHAMFGDADVSRYLHWQPMDLEQARAKVEQRLRQASIGADSHALVLAAIEAASGQYVGEMMLAIRSAEHLQGEIGWSMHPAFHGRGFATEGAREMLRVGFEVLGLHRIAAECDPRNGASIHVMEKLGMRREADLVESELVKGEWVGTTIFGLLQSEWRASGG
jgi:RimJ/RimL family protein N-acetyltransferase